MLARGAADATRRRDTVSQQLPEAALDLSRAVKALATYLEDPRGPDEARWFALKAARKATGTLEEKHDLAVSVLVGQRSPPCKR